jgi:hypothetical protein
MNQRPDAEARDMTEDFISKYARQTTRRRSKRSARAH